MLVDTHAHLDDEQFDGRLDAVLANAKAAGVRAILTVGTSRASSQRAVELAAMHEGLFAGVGIHPNSGARAADADWEAITRLAHAERVVAIGETGLDRHWDDTPFDVQQALFERHIELARGAGLPFIVHMRDCEADVIAALRSARERGELRGVMHAFSGSLSTALACLELGMHISFAGMVTFRRSDGLRDVAAAVPDDRLLLETDSPYLAPEPHRGRRPNEPALLVHTAECVARVRGVGVDQVARQTAGNAVRLFGLPAIACECA
ncbi:MAG: TatD family deoxyribonuclease [Planctomycetes bacterium]|nr:TatD family deoxyribonuclease [Planctomycetota bacterium]